MSCLLTGDATPLSASPRGVFQLESAGRGCARPPIAGPGEEPVGQRHVEIVAFDFPAAANDAARRKVEPPGAAADLDLLAVWQPVTPLVERVLQHDADVLELLVEIGGRGEAEPETDELGGGRVEVERADHQRPRERARAHLHLAHERPARRGPDGERVSQRVIVRGQPRRRERMRHIAHLVALADPDVVAEVVGDDAEVVAMVVDVGGKERPVAPAKNDLLAPVRGPPIHFHPQLVGLDQPRRLRQAFTHLRQEEDEPMRPRPIARERAIGLRLEPALGGAPHQVQGRGRVPGLRGER